MLCGWEAGTRTPIARSRVWSPTIGRPPSKRSLNLRIKPPVVNTGYCLWVAQTSLCVLPLKAEYVDAQIQVCVQPLKIVDVHRLKFGNARGDLTKLLKKDIPEGTMGSQRGLASY